MTDQNKHKYFKRIAGKRVERILEGLDALGNCSLPATYDYDNQELPPIFAAITEKLVEIRQRLITHSPYNGIPFRLQPPDMVELDGHAFDRQQLLTTAEVLELLKQNGTHFVSLEPVRERYQAAFGDELCWPVPVCSGTHLGCTLLAVREGLLCLPYDCLDGETYEQFAIQDIRLLSKEQAQLLLNRLRDTYTRLLNVLADAQAFGLVCGDNIEEVGHE